MIKPKFSSKKRGFSLIEVMIALAIGSLLLVGAMGLFSSNKRIYKEQNAMGRLQENARFALDIMIKDIRRAGYVGCSDKIGNVTNTLTSSGDADNLFNFTNPIEGSENGANWQPSNSAEAMSDILPAGSMATRPDAITVRYLAPLDNVISISADMPNNLEGTNITVSCTPADCSNNGPISVFENLAISDCASTDIFDATSIGATSLGHGNADFSKAYPASSQLSRYVTNRYYIGNGGNDHTGKPIPTLFRYTFAQDKDDIDSDGDTTEYSAQNQPLIEGVENLQILYGEDTDKDGVVNRYVNAADVENWDNVLIVQLAILVRTIEQDFLGDENNERYRLLDSDIYTSASPAADYHRRRIFSSTILIRNRIN